MKKLNLLLILSSLFGLTLIIACSKEDNKQKDQERMDLLLENIKSIAKNSTCEEQTELKYIAYGKKGCGGPTGYLVYTTSIDVEEFTKLIAQFNEVQINFSKKWNITISDCSIAVPPKSIRCENGKPVATYY